VGLPKSRKRYGDGGLIVAATKTRVFSNTSKVMFGECKVIQRRGLMTSNLVMGHKKLVQDLNNRFYQDKICSVERSIQAYELISKGEASNTRAVDSETLDSYSKDHSFKFKPIRQVETPKFNGGIRKLGIPIPRDKVVQKVMTMALQEIYEPKFLKSSYGLRPKKGTHSALKSVVKGWNGVKWFIEGDISKCFDTLEQLLKKEILKLEKIRAKYPSTIQGPGYRVYYVRYADDFLIGINGSRQIAEELKQKLQIFL